MNSITRIILRGLVSGEIKPEPEVFEYLKTLSERNWQRRTRILRRPKPAARIDIQVNQETPQPYLTSGEGGRDVYRADRSGSSDETRKQRTQSTFASPLPGRWIRLARCVLIGGIVLSHVAFAAQADGHLWNPGDPNPIQNVTSGSSFDAVRACSIAGMPTGILGVMPPFPHILLTVGGVFLIGFGFRAGWIWACDNWLLVLRPYERALQELGATRFRFERGVTANPCRAVRDILRKYLEAQFGLQIANSDPETIQSALRGRKVPMETWQRTLLDKLLESSGDEKAFGLPEFIDLSEQATRFVWATACCRPAKPTPP